VFWWWISFMRIVRIFQVYYNILKFRPSIRNIFKRKFVKEHQI